MIVVDAAAVVDALLDRGIRGDWARQAIDEERGYLHAPELLDYEVAGALTRMSTSRRVSAERARRGLADLADLRVLRYRARPLFARIWELRRAVSSTDVFYVALAESLGCPLVTTDDRLARTRGHEAEIRSPA